MAWTGQIVGKSFTLHRVSVFRGTRWERVNVSTSFFRFTKLQALLGPVIQESNPEHDVNELHCTERKVRLRMAKRFADINCKCWQE